MTCGKALSRSKCDERVVIYRPGSSYPDPHEVEEVYGFLSVSRGVSLLRTLCEDLDA